MLKLSALSPSFIFAYVFYVHIGGNSGLVFQPLGHLTMQIDSSSNTVITRCGSLGTLVLPSELGVPPGFHSCPRHARFMRQLYKVLCRSLSGSFLVLTSSA